MIATIDLMRKMQRIMFLLVATLSCWNYCDGQNWQWEWAQKTTGFDGFYCRASAYDKQNNYYLQTWYEDTLSMGDTSFIHPYDAYRTNVAVGVFDHSGKLKNAIDFYTLSGFSPQVTAISPLDQDNVYIGGTFTKEFHASDTILSGDGYSDNFIGLFDNYGKNKWVEVIQGPYQDYLYGILPDQDGRMYIAGGHTANWTPVWVNFFGKDSVSHTGSLIYLLKIDSLGTILWRKDIVSLDCGEVSVGGVTKGMDGNVYLNGTTRCPLIIGSDTLFVPTNEESCQFILGYNDQGEIIYKKAFNWSMSLIQLFSDNQNNFYFNGLIYEGDTLLFANDTILVPNNHNPIILGKMDGENNLIWHQLFDPYFFYNFHSLDFRICSDTIFASLTFDGLMTVDDSTYLANLGRRSLIITETLNGEITSTFFMNGSGSSYSLEILVDNCSDLALGGLFSGSAYMGADTLKTSRSKEGFVGKLQRWNRSIELGSNTTGCGELLLQAPGAWCFYDWNHGLSNESSLLAKETGWYFLSVSDSNYCWRSDSIYVEIKPLPIISLIADTSINYSDSLWLTAGSGFDSYMWSDGQTASSIWIVGGELKPGIHKIWVEVSKNGCENSDTVLITVKDNLGLHALEGAKLEVNMFPIPILDNATIAYELPCSSEVQVQILDFQGRGMETLLKEHQTKGLHELRFNASDYLPGLYYCQILGCDQIETRKIIILK